jgi:N-acetylglucosamine kinase-like BadF-type ATPase
VVATPAQVAALAPHLLAAARDGEAVAQRALAEAADELVALVAALERHFAVLVAIPVATTGSLLTRDSPLVPLVAQRLTARVPRAQLTGPTAEAPLGALALARELLATPD